MSTGSKKLFHGFALAPSQSVVLHFATGTLNQIAGRTRNLDFLASHCTSHPDLANQLCKADSEALRLAPPSRVGWEVQVVAVPFGEFDCDPGGGADLRSVIQNGVPGQMKLEHEFVWESYVNE